jgi:hypothetical protein
MRARSLCATHWARWRKDVPLGPPVRDMSRTAAQRFWEKVDTSGDCWTWTGAKSPLGYGYFNAGDNDIVFAHRWAWAFERGLIPNRLFVCHHCDNPTCVRVDHLFLGTNTDNVRDMIAKGRGRKTGFARGESINTAKLTEHGVRLIRERHAAGESIRSLAREHGVNWYAIQAVVRRKTWKHVT